MHAAWDMLLVQLVVPASALEVALRVTVEGQEVLEAAEFVPRVRVAPALGRTAVSIVHQHLP
jgi:hypothetical protein